jgi:hypothetical protein
VNDQFVIFTPSGTTWGSEISKTACGVHYHVSGGYVYDQVAWEFEKSGEKHQCDLTVTASHEYAEAATDPYENAWSVWGTSSLEEIADLCGEAGRGTFPGDIEVAKLWDDHAELSNCTASNPSPPQLPPKIATQSATGITTSKATLHGTGELNGLRIENYWFEWGTGSSHEHKGHVELGSNLKFGASESLTGLEANTTYLYRLVVEDAGFQPGKQTSADREFKTLPEPPTATTEAATSITTSGATLNGTERRGNHVLLRIRADNVLWVENV